MTATATVVVRRRDVLRMYRRLRQCGQSRRQCLAIARAARRRR